MFLHNLLNVLVAAANKMGLQKKLCSCSVLHVSNTYFSTSLFFILPFRHYSFGQMMFVGHYLMASKFRQVRIMEAGVT
jgi:hypothetical protein